MTSIPIDLRLERARSRLAVTGAAGSLLGLTAQIMRQLDDPLMALGAAIAPWVTIGFVLALWASRASWPTASRRWMAVSAMAVHLVAWLLTYHAVFAVRERVGLGAGWREAAPWLVVVVPAALLLGFAAAEVRSAGYRQAIAVSLPLAWSLPEIGVLLTAGGPAIPAAVLIAAVALLPAYMERATLSPARLVVCATLLGLGALVALPFLRGLIRA